MRLLLLFALLVLLAVLGRAAHAEATVDWNPQEAAAIASHGPWPPAPVVDPSNRVSGRPAAIALGRRLFDEPRLSGG